MRTTVVGLVLVALIQPSRTPRSVVDELLATDRGLAAEAVKTTAVPALSLIFADDVAVLVGVPTVGFARGKPQAIKALEANPDNAQGRVSWAPLRGGIAADGQYGFTFGYMALTRGDGSKVPTKYVAYWTKKPEEWRVAVYKTRDRGPTAFDSRHNAAGPTAAACPAGHLSTIAGYKASLEAAEREFSDEAQKIGLGPAFAKHGHADAVNVGPRSSSTFVVSAAEIGRTIGAGPPSPTSPVRWAPDEGVIVASSGDLGVTFGFIRQNNALAPGQPPAVPFVTTWRRSNVDNRGSTSPSSLVAVAAVAREGYHVVIVGQRDHLEVRGLTKPS